MSENTIFFHVQQIIFQNVYQDNVTPHWQVGSMRGRGILSWLALDILWLGLSSQNGISRQQATKGRMQSSILMKGFIHEKGDNKNGNAPRASLPPWSYQFCHIVTETAIESKMKTQVKPVSLQSFAWPPWILVIILAPLYFSLGQLSLFLLIWYCLSATLWEIGKKQFL